MSKLTRYGSKDVCPVALFVLLTTWLLNVPGLLAADAFKESPPVHLEAKTNLVISGLRITNAAGPGIVIVRCSNIRIVNCSIGPCTGVGVSIEQSDGVTISSNRFEKVQSGIYALTSRRVVVMRNYCRNVQGPMPRGQFVQFDKVNGPGNAIISNACENVSGQSNPEDAINLYQSSGTTNAPIGNRIRGGGPSASGGGIMTGDGGGSYILVKDNVLVDPGQYGISISGGDHIQIVGNKIFGRKQPFTNVGIFVWNQYSPACHGHTVRGNQVCWQNRDGANNPAWNAGNCGEIVGWEDNDWNAMLDTTILPENMEK